MILVASGTLLALLFSCFWFVLPYWAPGLVIRWSPWVEPVVRAGINHRNHEEYSSDYAERFATWGPTAFPGLSRCLRGAPDIRRAAIDSYPFLPAVARSSILFEPQFSRVIINVKPIHDDGVVWFQVRCHDTYLPPIHVRTNGQLQPLIDLFTRTRQDVGLAPSGAAALICELRMDAAAPYWLAADILAACGVNDLSSPLPSSGEQPARIDHLWLTIGRPPASYEMGESFLPFFLAPDKRTRPIQIALTVGTLGDLRISADGKVLGEIGGVIGDPPNSEGRLEAIQALIVIGLREFPEDAAFIVRAQADIPWSDSIAVADACWKRAKPWDLPALTFGPPLP